MNHSTVTTHIRSLFKEISWYGLGQGVAQACSLLGIIIVSRYFGPSAFGLYSFAQNYAMFFISALLGLNIYFTWAMAHSSDKEALVQEQFWYKVYLSVVLVVCGLVCAWYFLPATILPLVVAMLIPMLAYPASAVFHERSTGRFVRGIALAYAFSAVSLLIAKVVGVYYMLPLTFFIFLSGLDTVLVFIVLFIHYAVTNTTFVKNLVRSRPTLQRAIMFLLDNRYSIIVVILWQILIKVDQLTLALFSKAYTLGIYSAVTKIAEVPHFLVGVLYTACVPYIQQYLGGEATSGGKSLKVIFLTHVILGALLALGVIFGAPYIVDILYGNLFLEAVPVLRVYALSFPGMFLVLYYFSLYGARERHSLQAFILGVGSLVASLLVILVTPVYGLVGTAYVTVGMYTILALTFYYTHKA